MKINFEINIKTIGSILIGAIAAIGFFHDFSIAQSTSTTLTGKCAGVAAVNRKFQIVGNQKATDTIYLIDFDAKTMYSQGNITDTLSNPNRVTYVTQPMITESFTISSGDIPGSYVVTTTNGDKTIAIPVNGGNSFVFQFINDNIIGMCQKI
jgi:hypothetical protein